MAYINDAAFDAAIGYIVANGTRLDICSSEPTSYAQATSTYSLGNKTGLTLGAATDGDVSGRKTVVPAIADGSVTGTGTAAYWALTDGDDTLVATGDLAASQGVTDGNTFTLAAFDITFPDATSE